MKTNHTIGRIIDATYKCTSSSGNPSYYVDFEDMSGENKFRGYTLKNAECAYGVKNPEYKQFAYIVWHYTRKGNIIITYIYNKVPEFTKVGFRINQNHPINGNAKRNNVLNAIFSDVMAKYSECGKSYSGMISDLKLYKNNWYNEIDYAWALNGNLYWYFADARELFDMCGYSTRRYTDEQVWEMYRQATRETIDYILEHELEIV